MYVQPKEKIVIAAFAVIVASIATLALYQKPLSLFPHNETFFDISAVADTPSLDRDTTTWAQFDSSHGHLHFRYLLASERAHAKLLFHAHQLARTLNIANFSTLEIATDSKETGNFAVILYFYLPGVSDPSDMSTHRPYAFHCYVDSNHTSFKLPIREFATPVEWFSAMKITAEKLPPTDWKKLSHIAIMNIPDTAMSSQKTLALTSMQFRGSLLQASLRGALCGISAAILLCAIIVLARQKRRRKRNGTPTPRKADIYSARILEHIHINYGDKNLTLASMEREFNINSVQINIVIKTEFGMGYKQYVNSLRIKEAKRLLLQTELPISTIGETVGYPYANSFARTFRTITGASPNEFRKTGGHIRAQ